MRPGKQGNQGSDRDSVSSNSSGKSEDVLPSNVVQEKGSTSLQSSSSTSSDPAPLPVHKTQAAFVNKLYRMLEDPEMQDLISWSLSGDLFSVANPTQFSKIVLPQYFKHNNWQSFVRQLNMYGFHKVNDMIHHSNITNESQAWEFRHPSFRRGGILELQNIKRKSAKGTGYPRTSSAGSVSTVASTNRLANAAENLNTDSPDDPPEALQKHIYAMEDQIRKLAHSYDKLLADTTALKSDLARQNHMLTDIAAHVKLYNNDDNNPSKTRNPNSNGSEDNSPHNRPSHMDIAPRHSGFQHAETRFSSSHHNTSNHHSTWNDSAYSSTGESNTGQKLREMRSVLPPPTGYQRHANSLPSPRIISRRPSIKDEPVSTRSDPYNYRGDVGESPEWAESPLQLSPISRSPFRPSMPPRGASSPYPPKQNAQMALGRESQILNMTNEDPTGRIARDHEREEDFNKRRRL
ncbi:Flocculation suppression protein [Umbelopsis sp. WA50703]